MVEKIKVALIGIGNCFSGLIQGIEYYRKSPSKQVIAIFTALILMKICSYI